jgi:hypothetical protein
LWHQSLELDLDDYFRFTGCTGFFYISENLVK